MNSTLTATDIGLINTLPAEAAFGALLEPYLVEADRLTAAMAATQRQIDENWPRLQRDLDQLREKVCGSK